MDLQELQAFMRFFVTALTNAGPFRSLLVCVFGFTSLTPRELSSFRLLLAGVNVQNKAPPILARYDARAMENIPTGLKAAAGEAFKAVRARLLLSAHVSSLTTLLHPVQEGPSAHRRHPPLEGQDLLRGGQASRQFVPLSQALH